MLTILSVTFPFFALVFAGYLAARRGWLPLAAIPGLNAFVLYFALPCMLFRFGSSTPIAQLFNPSVALLYALSAVSMVCIGAFLLRRQQLNWNETAFGTMAVSFPNTGYMGLPLLLSLFGPAAVGTAIVTILVDMVITTSLCIALSRLGGGHGEGDSSAPQGAGQAARSALRGVATNPMPWAILSGAVVSAFAIVLPAPVAKTVALLADSASPVALFTIGAVLARSRMQAASGHAPAVPLGQVLPVVAIKLVVHPLVVLGVGRAAQNLGVALDDFALMVMVLVAALPSASNVSMLAERFGANNGRIARIILFSTMAAFLSFSGAVAWMTGL